VAVVMSVDPGHSQTYIQDLSKSEEFVESGGGKGATTGGRGGPDRPIFGQTTPTFYVAADCSARNWVYHPYFVLYNNLDQGIGSPNFENVVAPLVGGE